MKYLGYFVVLAFFIPNVSFAQVFNDNLYYGVQNKEAVIQLQEFLITQGDFNYKPTGNFYSLTLAAVKKFQAENNVSPISGYFGVLSRAVANNLLQPVAPLEETGTTTSVITPPVSQEPLVTPPIVIQPSPVVDSPPLASSPAPIIPSCTITVSTTTDPIGNITGRVEWTSQNASSGVMHVANSPGLVMGALDYKYNFITSPVESGESHGWQYPQHGGGFLDFKGVFTSLNGYATCEQSISD